MISAYIILALVALQRCVELAYAERNTRRLFARGGIELGARHYPLFILLHASWLVAIALFVPHNVSISWWLIAVFIVLQVGRVWAIRSLGPYWTTRLITVPDAALVRRGPYRFMRHPNYTIVVAEIAVLPLALGEPWVALIFSVLNVGVLKIRLNAEEQALAKRP